MATDRCGLQEGISKGLGDRMSTNEELERREEAERRDTRIRTKLTGDHNYWPYVASLPLLISCPVCGAVVEDQSMHTNWHLRIGN